MSLSGFSTPHSKPLHHGLPLGHQQVDSFPPLSFHGYQPSPLCGPDTGSATRAGGSLLESSALWDVPYCGRAARLGADLSSGSSGYQSGTSHTGRTGFFVPNKDSGAQKVEKWTFTLTCFCGFWSIKKSRSKFYWLNYSNAWLVVMSCDGPKCNITNMHCVCSARHQNLTGAKMLFALWVNLSLLWPEWGLQQKSIWNF